MNIFRLFPLIALLLALGFTSCNEEITNDGEFQETAVIFGLLNQADSLHYIKITRAFAGTNNSLEVAQIEDSSYFQNIEVTIDEVIGGVVQRSWTLGDTVLTGKVPGVFFSPDQKVYYFKTAPSAPLLAGAKYKLTANVNNGEFQVYGETALVQSLTIANPSQNAAFAFATGNVPQNGYSSTTVNVNPGTSQVLDARIKVYFEEYFNGNPVEKSFTWKLGELNGSEISSGTTPFYATGKTFYELVAENVTDDPTITKRELTRIQILVTGGSEDLSKYILLNKPSSSLAQTKPSYTNMTTSDGRRVIGLFSARSTVIQEKPEWVNALPYYRAIDKNSMKELCAGQITGSFLFCSDHPSDIPEPWYCP